MRLMFLRATYCSSGSADSSVTSGGASFFTDRDLAELVDPRWPDPGSEWLYSVPWGFRRLLNFVKVTSYLYLRLSRLICPQE